LWKTPDRSLNVDTLPCKSMHRITPLQITSSASSVLLKHISSNKPVTLAIPDPEKTVAKTKTSHILLLHEKDIYMHTIYRDYISFSSLPLDVYYIRASKDGYRTHGIIDLMDSNLLVYSDVNVAKKASTVIDTRNASNIIDSMSKEDNMPQEQLHLAYTSSKKIEKRTRFFPTMDNETLIFSSRQNDWLKALLQPLKKILMLEEIDEMDVGDAIKNLETLHQNMHKNEARLFNTKITVAKRKDSYSQVWQEIYKLVEVCQHSPNHVKILEAMKRLSPPDTFLVPQTGFSTTPLIKESQDSAAVSYSLPLSQKNQPEDKAEAQLDLFEQEYKGVREDIRGLETRFKKRKRHELENPLHKSNKKSLFYQYWSKTEKKRKIVEFDGRLESEQVIKEGT